MTSYRDILLASHGTSGARAAEAVALNLSSHQLHHLVVVPDFWQGMLGDDWLNNAITRIRYSQYVESQLEKEIQEHFQRVALATTTRNIFYSCEVRLGQPADCLVEVASLGQFDLVVMGSPRPLGVEGLNSRMQVATLIKSLTVPLLIVPYPRYV